MVSVIRKGSSPIAYNSASIHKAYCYDGFERWRSFNGVVFDNDPPSGDALDGSNWKVLMAEPGDSCHAGNGMMKLSTSGTVKLYMDHEPLKRYVLDVEVIGERPRLIFGFVDNDNYLDLMIDQTYLILNKIEAGTPTELFNSEHPSLVPVSWARAVIRHDTVSGRLQIFLNGELLYDETEADYQTSPARTGIGGTTNGDDHYFRHFGVYSMRQRYIDWTTINLTQFRPTENFRTASVAIAGRDTGVVQFGSRAGRIWEITGVAMQDTKDITRGSDITRPVYNQPTANRGTLVDFLRNMSGELVWINMPVAGETVCGVLVGGVSLPSVRASTRGRISEYTFNVKEAQRNGVDE